MKTDKKQNTAGAKSSAKFRKVCWVLVSLTAAILLVIVLLLYKPAGYSCPEVIGADSKNREVSSYLTHELLPQIYNGAQRAESFDLLVSQKGINHAIAGSTWPKEYDGITFLAPQVFFTAEHIVLMGTANLGGVEFVVSVEAEPAIDEQGMLNLRVAKVMVGAVNITPLARVIAQSSYRKKLEEKGIAANPLRAKIAASLLNNEPFEPVFKVPGDGQKVRADKITITNGKLVIHLVPVYD